MNRRLALTLLAGTAAAACAPVVPPDIGPDGEPIPQGRRLSAAEQRQAPFRAQDSVNALRAGAGLGPLALDDNLTAAAATHSRDMSLQNRPWHFGSDGSSPIERARRAGFQGQVLGEAISETFESEVDTIAAWMEDPGTRRVILDRSASRLGFALFQEPNGKIWYTMTVGTAPAFGGAFG
jgi:uncharacterized protein YkwD